MSHLTEEAARIELAALRAEVERLSAALDEARDELDIYRQTVVNLLGGDIPRFTREEFEEVARAGVPLADVIREIESGLGIQHDD
jgi:outer membrane protein TolC